MADETPKEMVERIAAQRAAGTSAPAPTTPPVKHAERIVCDGMTTKGRPCRRMAVDGTTRCYAHTEGTDADLGGRPTLYDADKHDELVAAHAASPKTDAQIAAAMDIAHSTLSLWLVEHPTFSEAHKRGRAELLDVTVMSLYKRALGYDYTTMKIERIAPPEKDYMMLRAKGLIDPATGLITKVTESMAHVPPDVGAGVFVVCNRLPMDWRHVQRIEVTGANGGPIRHADANTPEDELVREAEAILASAAAARGDHGGTDSA